MLGSQIHKATAKPTARHSLHSALLLQPKEAFELASCDSATAKLFAQACDLRSAGRFLEAAKTYERLLAVQPCCAEAVLNLGVCYLKLGHSAKARRLYIQTEAQTLDLRYNYALASLMVGKRYEAIAALRECRGKAAGAVASDISWALRRLETESPERSFGLESTESELEFSMVVKSTQRNKKHKKAHSLSLSSKGKSPPLPRNSLFKSVDFYAPGTTVHFRPIFHSIPTQTPKKQRKISYKVPLRPRAASSSDLSKASLSGRNPVSVSCLEKFQSQATEKRRRAGSLVEEDLEDQDTLNKRSFQMTVEEELHTTAYRLQEELDKDCQRVLIPEDSFRSKGSRLLPSDLTLIYSEMSKEAAVRDYSLLLSLLSKLHFFMRFRPPVREELLRVGTWLHIPRSQLVFRQGEPGAHVFAVLCGSVQVWRQACEYGSDPLLLHTLYDGDSFGEMSLFTLQDGLTANRSATCQAVEDSALLCIPKEEYHRIMVREVEIGLQAKLSVLSQIPLFAGAPQLTLVPLAATLSPLKFKIGDYIVHSGEIPKGLHVIISGRCSVLSEGFSLRAPQTHSDSVITQAMAAANPSLRHDLKTYFKTNNLQSLFAKGTVCIEKQLKAVLTEKYYFAGRCLRQAVTEPSKLAVVADSAEVTIYRITSEQVALLGEKLAAELLARLARSSDPDCPPYLPRTHLLSEFARWNKYKLRVVSQALKSNAAKA